VPYFEFAEEHAPSSARLWQRCGIRSRIPRWAYVREGPEWWAAA